MPYKNRATRLEYMRNYYRMRIKPENELRRVNKGLKPTPKTSASPYLKNPLPDAGDTLEVSVLTSVPSPLNPATARTPIPAKTVSPGASIFDFMRQQRAAQRDVSLPAAKGNRGIALGQEQEDRARRAGFIVDGCGNAWRVVKPDEF